MENFTEYHNLLKAITELPEGNVAVFASSETLNDDMLVTALKSNNLRNRIVYTSQVDMRDGLSISPFLQRYVVITRPIQLHLNPMSQLVIEVPALQIANSVGIGKHYRNIAGPFLLANNTKAYIYEKIEGFSADSINTLLDTFVKYYPSWKAQVEIQKSLLTIKNVSLGDVWGHLDIYNNVIYTHPGDNFPTSFNWVLGEIRALRIASTNINCNVDDTIRVEITSQLDTNIVELKHGEEKTILVGNFNNVESHVKIERNRSSGCDGISILLIK